MRIMGIDEAGRGPVIGPLVMAYVAVDEKKLPELEKLGIKDSKLLSPMQRERIYQDLIELKWIKYGIKITAPEEIDKILNSESTNLNWHEADVAAKFIGEEKPGKAILDCPSNNVEAFKKYITNKLVSISSELGKVNIQAEHKADLKYTIVGAASILAKVTRDREIEKIKEEFTTEFGEIGSGYPSDPITVGFLKKNHNKKELSHIFRKSWESYKKLAISKNQKKLGEF